MILGIGVDIIEVDRIQKAIERWGDDFLNHIFTPEEITHARKYKFPYPHYAGRFAAKEAIYKALGDTSVGWKDMVIINDHQGKPHCRYQKNGFAHQILLTISHSKNYAVANCIVTA
jgi:holo-[acyl-carrier protein] synthase